MDAFPYSKILVSGADAFGFLQAQLSNDLLLLEDRAQQLDGMSSLIELLRAELAFNRAYVLRDPSGLKETWVSADADWYAPWLLPRWLALRAFLEGDYPRGEQYLQQALRAADNCVVLSEGQNEALLAGYLRSLTRPVDQACPA